MVWPQNLTYRSEAISAIQLECFLDQLHDEDKVRWTLTTSGVFLAILLGKP